MSNYQGLINSSLWTGQELDIFDEFSGRCARCGNQAVTLHEIIPKSRKPKSWNTPENRIPLCLNCHLWAHEHGTRRTRAELSNLRTSSTKSK